MVSQLTCLDCAPGDATPTFTFLATSNQARFGPRAVKGTFVGYDPRSLAHIVKVNKTLFRLGHVKFNEDLSSREPLTASQDQAYQQLLDDLVQNAAVAPVTCSTAPPVVRDEPLAYDNGNDFPDDGTTEELTANGKVKRIIKVREAVPAAEPAQAPAPPAQTLRRSPRVNRVLSGHVKNRTLA